MQNKFEKQVQKKMEELSFTPSTPVWQNIESQIRNKKDRRRIVILFPLFVLTIGLACWFWYYHFGNSLFIGNRIAINSKTSNREAEPNNNLKPKERNIFVSRESAAKKKFSQYNMPHSLSEKPTQNNGVRRQLTKGSIITTYAVHKIIHSKTRTGRPYQSASYPFLAAFGRKKDEANKDLYNRTTREDDTKIAALSRIEESSFPFIIGSIAPLLTDKNILQAGKLEKLLNASKQTPIVRINNKALYRWKPGVVVLGGLSGTANGFNLFPTHLASAPASVATTSQGILIPYANVSNAKPQTKIGGAFGLGFTLQKYISKYFEFNVGLEYNYYSTSYSVGNKLKQGTILNNISSSNQYFTAPVTRTNIGNNTSVNWSNTFNAPSDYHNNFHFIGLPISLAFKFSKQQPIQLQGGLLLEQMIATDALVFDPNTSILYSDKQAFNHTQVFASFGFRYMLPFAKTHVWLSPHLDYGITQLAKNGHEGHMYYLGISANYLFGKRLK